MTLGQFLERYCFDTSYKCTNKKCGRYALRTVCVSVCGDNESDD
jgi:hypothetical protein